MFLGFTVPGIGNWGLLFLNRQLAIYKFYSFFQIGSFRFHTFFSTFGHFLIHWSLTLIFISLFLCLLWVLFDILFSVSDCEILANWFSLFSLDTISYWQSWTYLQLIYYCIPQLFYYVLIFIKFKIFSNVLWVSFLVNEWLRSTIALFRK